MIRKGYGNSYQGVCTGKEHPVEAWMEGGSTPDERTSRIILTIFYAESYNKAIIR